MARHEVKTPDLGDFHDVPVIEVLVKEGQEVAEGEGLVTLETEKAVMDVPAPAAGTVRRLLVSPGSKVSTGTAVAVLETPEKETLSSSAAPASPKTAPPAAPPQAPPPNPPPSSSAGGEMPVVTPDLGDFHDVPVIEVLVKEGQEVAEGEGLVTLESEKAVMDVPAPAAGTVRRLLVSPGSKVSTGTAVAVLETRKKGAPAPEAPSPQASPSPRPAAPVREEPPPVVKDPPAKGSATEGPRPVHAGPHVRRLARELGIDLRRVRGSGPRGRVRPGDLAQASTVSAAPLPSASEHARFGPVEVVPLGRIPRISGPRLQASWTTIPHVTQHDRADITRLDALRRELNAAVGRDGPHLTLLPFVLRACVLALLRHPTVNASLSPDGTELVLKKYHHIGVAVDTPQGLVVPVLRDVGTKDVFALARELGNVSARARDGRLTPADFQGGSFSVSSLGGIGGTAFTPIINAPEVAILGLSRANLEPVWREGAFVPRLLLPLSFSYDHRVIDGAEAARFTRTLSGILEGLEGLVA